MKCYDTTPNAGSPSENKFILDHPVLFSNLDQGLGFHGKYEVDVDVDDYPTFSSVWVVKARSAEVLIWTPSDVDGYVAEEEHVGQEKHVGEEGRD